MLEDKFLSFGRIFFNMFPMQKDSFFMSPRTPLAHRIMVKIHSFFIYLPRETNVSSICFSKFYCVCLSILPYQYLFFPLHPIFAWLSNGAKFFCINFERRGDFSLLASFASNLRRGTRIRACASPRRW